MYIALKTKVSLSAQNLIFLHCAKRVAKENGSPTWIHCYKLQIKMFYDILHKLFMHKKEWIYVCLKCEML